MTDEQQLKVAILLDVVQTFKNLKKSTSRRALVIKFKNQPAAYVINELVHQSTIRRKNTNVATTDEEYLPAAAAFELCGDNGVREEARNASTIVLHTLQNMFIGEQKKEGFDFEDLKRHVQYIYTNQSFDDTTLKLGLYLAKDLGALMGYRLAQPDETEVEWFQIAESAANMPNPESEWDRVMAGFKRSPVVSQEQETPSEAQWERIRMLGGGGQSDVFLVRSPARVTQRAACLRTIRTALDQDKRADLADAMWSYSRPESTSELGAMKVFNIPQGTPDGEEAIGRLRNEIAVLQQNRPGLVKLLQASEKERWIITEFMPDGSLERNLGVYKGQAHKSLRAFRSAVETVASLHNDKIVHRDIKPANVFRRTDQELVLGDFGIVFLPDHERLTATLEKVGPRDYMPQWGDLGERLEKVEPNFDVYMLGKLLWCMVTGRPKLPREYYKRPAYDVCALFPNDLNMQTINEILEKCVVEEPELCLKSAQELLPMVDDALATIERGLPMLDQQGRLTLPCRICGKGSYKEYYSEGHFRLDAFDNAGRPTNQTRLRVFVCDVCTHYEMFAPNFPNEAAHKGWKPWRSS